MRFLRIIAGDFIFHRCGVGLVGEIRLVYYRNTAAICGETALPASIIYVVQNIDPRATYTTIEQTGGSSTHEGGFCHRSVQARF